MCEGSSQERDRIEEELKKKEEREEDKVHTLKLIEIQKWVVRNFK